MTLSTESIFTGLKRIAPHHASALEAIQTLAAKTITSRPVVWQVAHDPDRAGSCLQRKADYLIRVETTNDAELCAHELLHAILWEQGFCFDVQPAPRFASDCTNLFFETPVFTLCRAAGLPTEYARHYLTRAGETIWAGEDKPLMLAMRHEAALRIAEVVGLSTYALGLPTTHALRTRMGLVFNAWEAVHAILMPHRFNSPDDIRRAWLALRSAYPILVRRS